MSVINLSTSVYFFQKPEWLSFSTPSFFLFFHLILLVGERIGVDFAGGLSMTSGATKVKPVLMVASTASVASAAMDS